MWEYAPQRIVPELRPYHDAAGSGNWTKVPGMLTYLRECLKQYPHVGIGEFHIHQIDPDDRPSLKQFVTLARENQAIVHLHSDAEPVNLLYQLEPELTMIWAHAGMSEPPDVIGTMFARHSQLYVDTSYRETEILGDGEALDPAWKALILKYPERFMVGTDTWINDQWAIYEELIDTNRLWLSKLPRDVAQMIAYKNAEKLFGRRVSNDLMGAR